MFSWISSQLTGGSFYSNDPSPMNPDQGNSETKSHMDLDEKSLPPPERPRLSSKSSSLTLDRTHPSNISWIPSNGSSVSVPGTPKSLTFPNGTPSIHTPSPEPSLTRGGFLSSLRRPTGQKPSSESLRLPQDRARVSWDPKEEKTLSPIEEREHEQSVSDATATLHFPSGSTRRPSVDSMPKTPDSACESFPLPILSQPNPTHPTLPIPSHPKSRPRLSVFKYPGTYTDMISSTSSPRLPNTTPKPVYKPLLAKLCSFSASTIHPTYRPAAFLPTL